MSQQRVMKILSADDHHLIREGIATVIGRLNPEHL